MNPKKQIEAADLATVEDSHEVKQNIRRFNIEFAANESRARSLATQTTFWVYDPSTQQFGPGKFVGYKRMNFVRYEAAIKQEISGDRFDGAVTRNAIEEVVGKFEESSVLQENLNSRMNSAFGNSITAGVNKKKWQFATIDCNARCWAVVCNPDKYDGLAAVSNLDEMCWTLDRGDPQPGDRIAIWQAKGTRGRRGIIALGEVTEKPSTIIEADEEGKYWKQNPANEPARRTRFRILKFPNLPIWESEHPELLSNLAVARARGGTVFSLQEDQWKSILQIATDVERCQLVFRKQCVNGQGFGLSASERKAVERHAQQLAENHYLQEGYEVTDVSQSHSYDLHCESEGDELHVEVKGTTGDGDTVFLTRNEVAHARIDDVRVALFFVGGICLDRIQPQPVASGGDVRIFDPWDIDKGTLKPMQFEYRLPDSV